MRKFQVKLSVKNLNFPWSAIMMITILSNPACRGGQALENAPHRHRNSTLYSTVSKYVTIWDPSQPMKRWQNKNTFLGSLHLLHWGTTVCCTAVQFKFFIKILMNKASCYWALYAYKQNYYEDISIQQGTCFGQTKNATNHKLSRGVAGALVWGGVCDGPTCS